MSIVSICLVMLNAIAGIWNLTDCLGPHNYFIAGVNFSVAVIIGFCA